MLTGHNRRLTCRAPAVLYSLIFSAPQHLMCAAAVPVLSWSALLATCMLAETGFYLSACRTAADRDRRSLHAWKAVCWRRQRATCQLAGQLQLATQAVGMLANTFMLAGPAAPSGARRRSDAPSQANPMTRNLACILLSLQSACSC
jgi:hypothetical protein